MDNNLQHLGYFDLTEGDYNYSYSHRLYQGESSEIKFHIIKLVNDASSINASILVDHSLVKSDTITTNNQLTEFSYIINN